MQPPLPLVERLWPGLAGLRGYERSTAVWDMAGLAYSAPLALAGLVWLAAVTEPARLVDAWPLLLLLLGLLFIFQRLQFFVFTEIEPGAYTDWSASLGDTLVWSAALIFGPGALWLFVVHHLAFYTRRWRRSVTPGDRWSCLRNASLSMTETVLGGLAGLALYQAWGGRFPLPGLAPADLLPALGATLVAWLVACLVWLPLLVYFFHTRMSSGASPAAALRFWGIAMGWPLLVNPFAILAAGLYSLHGPGIYLFLVAGLLLASLLAHRLSQAAERSGQRSRELERLERLGRAIADAGCCETPADLPGLLPDLLTQHVADMFPYSQLEIRLFPAQRLWRHPEPGLAFDERAWAWLADGGPARYVAAGQALPWGGRPERGALAVAPILNVADGRPIGGVCLARRMDHVAPVLPDLPPMVLPALQSLAAQVASALNSAEVYAERMAHQRVEQELVLAGQIQASFLPETLPSLPGWQLAASLRPARETSGDFYDVFVLPNGHLALLVADVADKGMGAALYMALCRTLLRVYAAECCTEPDVVLRATNRRILSDTRAAMFVTVFYAILDPASGELVYCNAGHNPPYLAHARDGLGGNDPIPLTGTGMALGVLEEGEWRAERARLAPGDMLVLYTDGITEARDGAGSMFGEARLVQVVRAARGQSAAAAHAALLGAVRDFAGASPPDDDITLLLLAREPGGAVDPKRPEPGSK
jgi:serine phosphatase RsbU (regulator of sigma subunit)